MRNSDLFARHLRTVLHVNIYLLSNKRISDKTIRHYALVSAAEHLNIHKFWASKRSEFFCVFSEVGGFTNCNSGWNSILSRSHPKTKFFQTATSTDYLKGLNFCHAFFSIKHFKGIFNTVLLLSRNFGRACRLNFGSTFSELEIAVLKMGSTLNEKENAESLIHRADLSETLKHGVSGNNTKLLEDVSNYEDADCVNVTIGIAVCNVSEDGKAVDAKDVHESSVVEDDKPSATDNKPSDTNVCNQADNVKVDQEMRRPCDEKLQQFKAKLAMKATVIPADLLEKTTELVTKDPSLACAPCDEVIPSESKEANKFSKKHREKKKKANDVERPKRTSPTHFVAIQVTNPEIHKKIGEIQEMVVKEKSLLKGALVNLPTLHLTLMVMYLEGEEQIERAKVALDVSKKRILELGFGNVELPFSGIGDFHQTIVFAKVQEGHELDHLKVMAETVRMSFAEQSLCSSDDREFAAHLTIMKLSRDPRLFHKIKKIDRNFYADMKDEFLGLQPLASLQLCAMKRAENGYYPIEHEVAFDENQQKNEKELIQEVLYTRRNEEDQAPIPEELQNLIHST